jgi:hypothetical protein
MRAIALFLFVALIVMSSSARATTYTYELSRPRGGHHSGPLLLERLENSEVHGDSPF